MASAIRIGEINSYSFAAVEAWSTHYRRGIELAIHQINESGGVLGRPLELVVRDDGFVPARAAEEARKLIVNDKVDILGGGFSSDVGLAISATATEHRKVYVAAAPRVDDIVWSQGSRYTFRIQTPQHVMLSALAGQVAAFPCRRWVTISPDYSGARKLITLFGQSLKASRAEAEFVRNIWYPMGQLDARRALDEMEAAHPDAVFSVTYGNDLTALAREGSAREFFAKLLVVNPLAGQPEYLEALGGDAPPGWLVLGYPWDQDHRMSHKIFRDAYQRRYNDFPRFGSLIGHITMHCIAAGIARARSTDSEALIGGFRGLEFESPVGRLLIRAGDHQSTLGSWIGKLALRDGKGYLTDWTFFDGKDHLPPEREAMKFRPPDANR